MACGATKDEKPDSQPVQGGAKLAALWPLTGEKVTSGTPKRPVLVTKIDNSAESRPQLGLKEADLITEELVEGGITRLAVFYYQNLPKVAGPVRSMRATDIGIVKPALATIIASGAAPATLKRLKAADITFFDGEGPGYFRDKGRSSPYNLMAKVPEIAAKVEDEALVPASYLPWGAESDFPKGKPATGIQAAFSRSRTTSWRFRDGRYRNENSFAAPGQQFVPDSVLVVRVRVADAGYLDPAGNKVPETIYSGTGPMMLFHDGRVLSGTWTKKSTQTPIRLRTAAGPLKVPSGRVWVELVPTDKDGGRVTVTQ